MALLPCQMGRGKNMRMVKYALLHYPYFPTLVNTWMKPFSLQTGWGHSLQTNIFKIPNQLPANTESRFLVIILGWAQLSSDEFGGNIFYFHLSLLCFYKGIDFLLIQFFLSAFPITLFVIQHLDMTFVFYIFYCRQQKEDLARYSKSRPSSEDPQQLDWKFL